MDAEAAGLRLVPAHAHLPAVVLVDHLIENHQASDLVAVVLGVVAIAHLPDPPRSLHEGIVAGVVLSATGVGGVEGALVFLDDGFEDRPDVPAQGDVPAEGLYLQPTQVQVLFFDGALEIDRFDELSAILEGRLGRGDR